MSLFGLFGPPNIEKIKAKRDVAKLIEVMESHNDSVVRKKAAKALGEIGDIKAVGPLVAMLEDENESLDVLLTVAWALGELGDIRAVEPLIALLKGKVGLRLDVITALDKIVDVRAVEPLIAALQDENWQVRREIVRILGSIKDSRVVEPLIATLKDGQSFVREAAAKALGKTLDARAVEPLIAILYSHKKEAAQSLGEIGDPRAVKPLFYLFHNARLVRLDWEWKNPEPDYSIVGHDRPPLAADGEEYALQALIKLGASVVKPVLMELVNSDEQLRESADAVIKI